MTSPNVSRIPVRIFLAFILLLFSFSVKVSATQQSGLAAIPSSNNFGTVPVGSSKTATETLTNSGNGKVTVSQVTITGAGFSLSGLNLPIALTSGQSYTFTVQFAPKTSGSVTGNISLVYGRSSSTMSVAVSGTGSTAGNLAVSPSALSFGSVAVGSSKSMSASLSATGASDCFLGNGKQFGIQLEWGIPTLHHRRWEERVVHSEVRAADQRLGLGQPFVQE